MTNPTPHAAPPRQARAVLALARRLWRSGAGPVRTAWDGSNVRMHAAGGSWTVAPSGTVTFHPTAI